MANSFMTALNEAIGEDYNESITENGALGYKTTQNKLLDINFKVASYRNTHPRIIVNDFMAAYYDHRVLALRWLFMVRDIREGLGERRYFRIVIQELAKQYPEIVENLIPLFAEYGRYDDLFVLLDTVLADKVYAYIRETLEQDTKNLKKGKPVSLLAKWMPSENASSQKTKALARNMMKNMTMTPSVYRKILSGFRREINLVETQMSKKEWAEINYSTVPSRANLIYNSAFLRNDEERRREFLGKAIKGEVKVNSSVLYPHEIVSKYRENHCIDDGLEALWKNLPNSVDENNNTLVVADGSGSMMSSIGNTKSTAWDVAHALAIYFAERASGDFKNKYITFSSKPQLVELTGKNLYENIRIATSHFEISNTNIEATFDLILKTAKHGKMKQNELPENILIISDMEFDSATTMYEAKKDKLFAVIAQKFKDAGYKMPKLIFWNVDSRTGTIPVKENELGVALVSGFSTNIIKMVMTNELDPWKITLNAISNPRYNAIEEAVKPFM